MLFLVLIAAVGSQTPTAAPKDAPKPIAVVAPADPSKVSYAREVADILDAKCVGCHSSALAENALNLEDVASMKKGGKRGPALVPGKADASLLFRMAAHRVEPVMPPRDKKSSSPLTGAELGKLQAWIDRGAPDDSEDEPAPAPIELAPLPPGVQPILGLDIAPDGRHVAVARGNLVAIHRIDDGVEVARLAGHRDLVQSVRFTPDGSRLLAGGYVEVIVWSTDRPLARPVEIVGPPAPEPKALVGPPAPEPKASWTETARFGPHRFRVLAIDVSPDGKLLATAGGEPSKSGEIQIRSLPDGKIVRSLDGLHSDSVFALRFSPDGKRLATGAADRFVKLVEVDSGKELEAFEGHTHHILGLAWKADGKEIASAGADGAVKFWDPATGEQLRSSQGTFKAFTAISWPKTGNRVVLATADGSIREAGATGNDARINRTVSTGGSPPDYLQAVAATDDGKRIVAGGADGVLSIFNGGDGKLLQKVEPPR
ncbi:MAG: c-type cytochrome domain-containing protein [Isosphaeraceae bacterium]|nr:c-type cytochrome domain-containing protein [Isosphaeraceae bacterium]